MKVVLFLVGVLFVSAAMAVIDSDLEKAVGDYIEEQGYRVTNLTEIKVDNIGGYFVYYLSVTMKKIGGLKKYTCTLDIRKKTGGGYDKTTIHTNCDKHWG